MTGTLQELRKDALVLYLSTTQGVFRLNPDTGGVARLGPLDTSTEALAVAGATIVAAVTPDYGTPMRDPLRPASHRGLVRSADGGTRWSPVDSGLAGGQVTALGVTAGGALVAGTDPAEVLVSRDGGQTWTQGQSLREMPGYDRWSYPLQPHTPHVMLFACHPSDPNVVYAGIEVGGIVRSDDGGRTWRVIGAGSAGDPAQAVHPDLHGLAICSAAPDTVYASTPQGVYVSDDAGESWQHRIDGLDPLYCRPIAVHGTDRATAVVVATHGAGGFFGIAPDRTGGAVFRTVDAGRSWRRVTAGLPDPLAPTPSIAADPARPARFYLPLFSGEVYASDDASATWRELARGLPPILRCVAV